ncbi:MAG TPA: S1/P1 nuclease [Opitutaceae bacterium]|nr:S1/P1 nuclease [Opitutaceae bacterium]
MPPSSRRTCIALALALAFAAPAFPWGVEGHRALALLAEQRLSAEARSHVVKILGNDDLASISVWMDDLRPAMFHTGPLGSDPEALRFNAEFPQNGQWHYVNVPLGAAGYEPEGAFSDPHDVVHMIGEAVSVLEGGGDRRITKLEALRMVVHFVGDEHQPLHVGNGFYEIGADAGVKLVADPAAAKDLPNDKGGNALFFGPGRFDELHAYWDVALVARIVSTGQPADLAKALESEVAAEGASWKSVGDYHHWAEGWATESLVAARTAYEGISFGAETPDPKGGIKSIKITFPPHYDERCMPLAQKRLAQAGYHLAELLNAIHWSD